MSAIHEKISTKGTPSHLRIAALVEAAAKRVGGYRQLAEAMEVHPQLISNWKNGVKTPSPEAQADMALTAGADVMVVNLMATMEKTTGKRYERLQNAYRQWMTERTQFLDWKRKISTMTSETAEAQRMALIK